jgi:hypothetical protein
MKKIPAIIFFALLLLLAAGYLAWPGMTSPVKDASTSTVTASSQGTSSATPFAEPPAVVSNPARIAMPTVPTVAPAKSSMAEQDASENSSDDPGAFADAQTRAMAAKQAALQQAMKAGDPRAVTWAASLPTDIVETDWGVIQVVDGVPMELTTSAGDPVTITPTVRPDGTLSLQLKMEHTDGDTRSEMNSRIITKPGDTVELGVGNQSFKMTPTL